MTDTLWAPWRMEYILSLKDRSGCIFCAFPERGPEHFREDLVLLVQPHAFVCLNRYPFAPGHLLIVPRRHVAKLEDLKDEEYDGLMRLLRDSLRVLEGASHPEGMNVGMNLGRAGGAGIADHLHAHVVPRWNGDNSFMPVLANTRIIPEHLEASWKRLRPAFEPLPGMKGPLP